MLYKLFTWTVVILTALFGTFLTGFLTGAMTMSWLYQESPKTFDVPK
jgi:hypothetical protein